jgi:hypothetical protein
MKKLTSAKIPKHIPKRVMLHKRVCADFPYIQNSQSVVEPGEHEVVCNRYGAVSVDTPGGRLGLKPGEYTVLEWTENPQGY